MFHILLDLLPPQLYIVESANYIPPCATFSALLSFLPLSFKHTPVHPVLKHPQNRFTSVRVEDQVSRRTTGNIMLCVL
jgi:hypothetical protein